VNRKHHEGNRNRIDEGERDVAGNLEDAEGENERGAAHSIRDPAAIGG